MSRLLRDAPRALKASITSQAQAKRKTQLCDAAPQMRAVLQELQESAGYWSEYDVPLGIVDRINDVIKKATGDAL